MTDDSNKAARAPEPADDKSRDLPRRQFLKTAGAGAGLLLVGGGDIPGIHPASNPHPTVAPTAASPEVVVIGAGGWGSFTAYNLRKRGVKVTLVDAYGPGNARSTSGDETRGVRSSYGDRTGIQGEQWTLLARKSMTMWKEFDAEWGKPLRLNLFHVTGDLIMRTEWDSFMLRTKVWWDKNKIPYQVLNPDDVRKSFPVISMDDITAVLYEPDAGVVRARRAAQAAAAAFEALGGKIVIGRATPGRVVDGKLTEVKLDTGQTLRADTFVFCVGPWLGKTFPDIFEKKTRTPMGYVVYFATPINDHRFTYPNLPSYNFPGVTGWAALPVDNRGFRVRGTERAPVPPAVADSLARLDSTRTAQGRGAAPGDTTRAGRGGGRGNGGGGGGRGGQQNQQPVDPKQADPDTSDRWADQSRVDGSRRFVAHRFPLLKDAPVAQTHSCHYESTVSNNFIIDVHPKMLNVWIAAGGNAEGFKQCPVIGEYVSGRVVGIEGDPALKTAFKIPEKDYPPPTPADSTRRPPPPSTFQDQE
jgi:glycine/D-amino acid oxidase-like deaminating enzyme